MWFQSRGRCCRLGVNAFVPPDLAFEFHYFFTRKYWFLYLCKALVIFPGGYGTMDELFEALTLIQTGKIRHFPIILVGSAFFAGLIEWVKERLLTDGMIDPGDVDLLVVTDDPEEVVRIVKTASRRRFEDAEAEEPARRMP